MKKQWILFIYSRKAYKRIVYDYISLSTLMMPTCMIREVKIYMWFLYQFILDLHLIIEAPITYLISYRKLWICWEEVGGSATREKWRSIRPLLTLMYIIFAYLLTAPNEYSLQSTGANLQGTLLQYMSIHNTATSGNQGRYIKKT